MKIRLGYVALSKTIDITSSHSFSYSNFLKNNEDFQKLDEIIKLNLQSLNQIIDYNIKNNIHFYRISSNLIPLASMKIIKFNYINKFKNLYKEIGDKIKKYNIRVDMHPDQFTVLNSTKKEVLDNTFEILNYHYNVLDALNIEEKVLILHVGSNVFGKNASITRFINNFNKLPNHIKKSIVIENDDKIFNIIDTLELCEKINRPMVLDYHHYICNNGNIEIKDFYKKIFSTWKNINPKIHFSSPKNKTKKDIRSHHDYINSDDFISFIEQVKYLNFDLDIMLEAKAKDEALFRLLRELKYKTNYKFIDETTFEV
ncbi:MAG: UV DNA damage repair endonuclease UvsE [Firmicutes bacterium]|nr:UV DNA damage repair endonuclease UvsE [Bacillota bacterium]